jgi:hypothetical protein
MSEPRPPLPAKLIIGFLFRDFQRQRRVLERVSEQYGPLDFLTEPELFTYTQYYEREMGTGIYRQTGSFLHLVSVETLPAIKRFTNVLEMENAPEGNRQINVDPGLLSEERLILATGKNYTHRIHLQDGVYADLTLIYQGGAYQALPWTYPDYQNPALRHYLGILRLKLAYQRSGRLPRKYFEKGETS